MIYGKRGSLKKENEVTKEISDPCVEKGRNFATNPEALTSRALGLMGPPSPPAEGSRISTTPPTTTIPKCGDLLFCTLNMIQIRADGVFLIRIFRGARRGCSVLRHGCRWMDVVAAERETRVGEVKRRFETLSIWQERGE